MTLPVLVLRVVYAVLAVLLAVATLDTALLPVERQGITRRYDNLWAALGRADGWLDWLVLAMLLVGLVVALAGVFMGRDALWVPSILCGIAVLAIVLLVWQPESGAAREPLGSMNTRILWYAIALAVASAVEIVLTSTTRDAWEPHQT